MNHKHVKLDLNAKITDLGVAVQIEDGIPYADVEFRSTSPKILTEIRFIARGFGAGGEILPIDGKDRFILVMQDLAVPAAGIAKGLRAKLPREDIRQIELGVMQYSFADGSVERYEGAEWIEFDVDEFDPQDEEEASELAALRKRYPQTICRPVQLEKGWICLCGNYNPDEEAAGAGAAAQCAYCAAEKETAFSLTREEHLKELAEKYRESEELRREEQSPEREKTGVQLRKNGTQAWQQDQPEMPGYGTENADRHSADGAGEEARQNRTASAEFVSGVPQGETAETECRSSMDTKHKIMFVAIAAAAVVALVLLLYFTSPGRVSYVTSGTSSGTGGYDSGYRYQNNDHSGHSSSYESKYTALSISDVEVSNNSLYCVCTGTVTNSGSRTYSFVKVKGAFKNSSGTVLDTDWTYAVGAEGLAPGESSAFRMSVDKNYRITDCSVTLMS